MPFLSMLEIFGYFCANWNFVRHFFSRSKFFAQWKFFALFLL